MNTNYLFALDKNTNEVIISESPRGSNKINFIERINQIENVILFDAVVVLTSIATASTFDEKIFKAMDKVCQLIYLKHKQTH